MKKIITLLAGFAMAATVQAAISYTWSSKTVTEGDTSYGVVTEKGGVITQVNGEGQINYQNGSNFTVCLSGKKNGDNTYGSSSVYMQIDLDKPIEEGSTLEITAYRNKDTDAVGSIHYEFVNPDAEKPVLYVINEGNNKIWNNIHANVGQEPNTISYELPEAAIGATKIILCRDQASTNMFILSIVLSDLSTDTETEKNVLVVSPELDEDPLYFGLQDGFVTDWVKSLDEIEDGKTLDDYDVLLVSNKVNEDKDGKLREKVAYFPMVNLSAELIKAWGMGTFADSEYNYINVSNENLDNDLFVEVAVDEGVLELVADGVLPVVTPGDYLAKDVVYATVGEGEAAVPYLLRHTSTSNQNTHILIPLKEDNSTEGENFVALIRNAVNIAASTKKAVTSVAQPKFEIEQANLATTVTINSSGTIYYALGADADVKANGKVYTEPLYFEEPETIKAYAVLDGFHDSGVASYVVPIAAKAEVPVISYKAGDDGKSTVITITTNMADAEIHYSFKGQSEDSRRDADKTAVYTEPLVVTEPTQVFAFVTGKDLLPSELAKMNISIPGVNASNIRLDEVSHFTAADTWHPGASNPTYVGKNDEGFGFGGSTYKAYSHFTSELLEDAVYEDATNEDGSPKYKEDGVTPVKVVVKKAVYAVDPNSKYVLTNDEQPDWKIVTEGQQLCFENVSNSKWPSEFVSNGNGYDSPLDLIDQVCYERGLGLHKGLGKSDAGDTDPSTARVESTKAFAAPFDIVVFVRSNKGGDSKAVIETSTDGENWKEEVVAKAGSIQRSIKRTRHSVEGDGNYFVRVRHAGSVEAQVTDIIILNNGEVSKKYTGIEDVIATEGAEVIAVEYYNLNGVRIAEPTEGFFIKRATLSNGKIVVEKIVK